MNSNETYQAKINAYNRSASIVAELLKKNENILAELVYLLDDECQKKLASGRDDLFGSVIDLRLYFAKKIWHESEPDYFPSLKQEKNNEILQTAIFDALLSELHRRGDILLVGDRQRARSRAFEVVHYLRRLKQRTDSKERDGIRPELVDMVKVEVQKRERPIRSVGINDFVDGLEDQLSKIDFEKVEEYLEVPEEVSFEYHILTFAYECFKNFLTMTFGQDGKFPVFQQESFYTLLKDAFKNKIKTGRVIAAGTGFGKTEAFLFPLLFYTICLWYVREKKCENGLTPKNGFSSLLLYPRIDLCNNQAERLLSYVANLNDVLKKNWNRDNPSSLKIAIAHSGLKNIRIQCPLCRRELNDDNKAELDRAYIVPVTNDFGEVVKFKCERNEIDHSSVADTLVPQIKKNSANADFGITTVDTLHRRLMDDHGTMRLFNKKFIPPRFIVIDEMHIYEGQSGSHVSHILRRCRHRIKNMNPNAWNPIFVGASATTGNPADLASRMFDAPRDTQDPIVIAPTQVDKKTQGLEYFFFLQSSGNRFINREEEEEEEEENPKQKFARIFVSEQATMIQAAMCLSHNIKRPSGVGIQKRRTLGFIDSIDVATRLSRNLSDAEWKNIAEGESSPIPLYAMRFPTGVPNAENSFKSEMLLLNPQLDIQKFQLATLDCNRAETKNCVQPPHPLLERCERYESGECWHVMARQNNEGLVPLSIQVHTSKSRTYGNTKKVEEKDHDNWRLLVTTSALEVGFDHPELISTWQYHAPPSISSFVQRKGRGGRGITDYPITMVVLGKSSNDIFQFQDHLKLVAVSENDITSVLDESNPSIRQQHLLSALLDFCAGTKPYIGAYNLSEMSKLASACDSSEARKWLEDCFGISRLSVATFLNSVKRTTTDYWDKTLSFSSLEKELQPNEDVRPSNLFAWDINDLIVFIDRLSIAKNKAQENPTTANWTEQDQTTLLWLLAANKAATENKDFKTKTIVDFCRFLPQEFIVEDIYAPSTTIPVPIGRFINIVDKNNAHLGVEPSEFGLKCFLPGGFKIRYEQHLWMAPWECVPSKPKEIGSSKVWVGTSKSIVTRKKEKLTTVLGLSTLDDNEKNAITNLLGMDCLVAEIDSLRVQDLGKPKGRGFSMEKETLRIVIKKENDAETDKYKSLARDPNITSKCIFIPQSNNTTSLISIQNKLPFMLDNKIRFYDNFKLTLCFYANLVNCYMKDEDAQTIVLRFWDEEKSNPISPAISMRTQAIEFQFNDLVNFKFTPTSKTRAFWARLDELILNKMVIETGVLSSTYLVTSVIETLKLIEPRKSFCEKLEKETLKTNLENLSASFAPLVDKQIVTWCIKHIEKLSELILESKNWCENSGFQRAAMDSLASALCRVAAQTINVSPKMFRRKTFLSNTGPRLILFDNVEGGSGNARRLRDVWTNVDLKDSVAKQVNCEAAEVDSIVFGALDSGLSPESLSQITFADSLPNEWTNGKSNQSKVRAKLRLQRLVQSPEIAAFNSFIRQQWHTLVKDMNRTPSWIRLYSNIFNANPLDIRAANLKRDFLNTDLGSPNELKARVQELMPLCEGACPECLLGDMFAEKEFVDRDVLDTFLNHG